MASRSIAGHAVPGIVVLIFWVIVVVLAIILLALVVHWLGGGALRLRLGHFNFDVGVS